jgi:hypothetical protein
MTHRVRSIALAVLAVLGLALGAYAVRRPLVMSAPSCMGGQWHGC